MIQDTGKPKLVTIYLGYNNAFAFQKWEVMKSNHNGWAIVTNVDTNTLRETKITVQPITLSKYSIIRKFQLWMLKKIFTNKK